MLGLYAQDQYKIKPNLTATLGLRWDPNTPAACGRRPRRGLRAGPTEHPVPQRTRRLVFPGDAGLNDQLYKASYSYFEPRIGLAWTPIPTTSIRAAFGLFTTPMEDAFYQMVWRCSTFLANLQPRHGAAIPFDNPWTKFPGGGGTCSPDRVPSRHLQGRSRTRPPIRLLRVPRTFPPPSFPTSSSVSPRAGTSR